MRDIDSQGFIGIRHSSAGSFLCPDGVSRQVNVQRAFAVVKERIAEAINNDHHIEIEDRLLPDGRTQFLITLSSDEQASC